MKKRALIFGVTGQDGYYLSKLFFKKKLYSSWSKKESRILYIIIEQMSCTKNII